MGEFIPIVDKGANVKGYISLGADFIYYLNKDKEDEFIYLYTLDGAKRIDLLIRSGKIDLGGNRVIEINKLLDKTKNVFAYTDEESIIKFLIHEIGEKIRNKTIIHSFSGGKDSIAALYILLKLLEHISFKLKVVYVFVPYLEALETLNFLDEIMKKLCVDIEVIEANRKIMEYSFNKYGMPIRGFRWCTYLKVRAIRNMKKKLNADFEVKGDRAGESYKRFKTLFEYAKQQMIISGKQMKPIFFMTLLDVIKITRKLDLVHPQYKRGCPRVACEFCPYKNLFEFYEISDVEDPGFIDLMIKKSYNRGYNMTFEEYVNMHLWRFHPDLANKIYILNKLVKNDFHYTISLSEILDDFTGIWINPLPSAPVLDIKDAFKAIIMLNKSWKFKVYSLEELKNLISNKNFSYVR